MGYINTDKNLKLALISPEGRVETYYNEDYNNQHHFEIMYDAILKDFKNNKKLVTKAKKNQGKTAELVKLMKNSGFIVIYDSTNYNNYKEHAPHSACIVLPKEPTKLEHKQLSSFLKISREMPSIYDDSEYEKPYNRYETTQVAYSDKHNNVVDLGNLDDVLINIVSDDKQEIKRM